MVSQINECRVDLLMVLSTLHNDHTIRVSKNRLMSRQ
jgi:hypothetical protein